MSLALHNAVLFSTAGVCVECKQNAIPAGSRKFCSDKCAHKASYRRAKIKRANGIATGKLYGKPIQRVILERYQKSAQKKEVPFELTYDEFCAFWHKPCTYCGANIETIGLDRIDSDLGYTKENVAPCCTLCNMTKRAMLPEDYIAHCIKVARKSGLRV